jgi:hypothetical protein
MSITDAGGIEGRIAYSCKERRRVLARRVRAMERIAALPCGFAHAVPSAVKTAVEAMKPVLRALSDDAVREAKERFRVPLQRRLPSASTLLLEPPSEKPQK